MKKIELVGRRFYLKDNREELSLIGSLLNGIYNDTNITVKSVAYDEVYSHEYEHEDREDCDYIINYELSINNHSQIFELFYLKGNGNYIVITEV